MIWEHAEQEVYANNKGVYYIRNTQTNRVYIGKTTRDFLTRWNEHITELRENKHSNSRMQKDYNAGAVLSVGVLCSLQTKEIIDRAEELLIAWYKERAELYNVIGVIADTYESIPNQTKSK